MAETIGAGRGSSARENASDFARVEPMMTHIEYEMIALDDRGCGAPDAEIKAKRVRSAPANTFHLALVAARAQ